MASLGAALALAACASQIPETFPASVVPGKGKDLAAFQQDDAVCRHHALAHTGYASLPPPAASGAASGLGAKTSAAGTGPNTEQSEADGGDEVGYLQCMAARGDTVQVQPGYAEAVSPYFYAAPYGYPYGYGYPFGFGDFYGGVDLGFGYGGGRYRGWHGGHWGHGGFAHAGGGHGGGGHGGGGHR
jgi:hypothetical protein